MQTLINLRATRVLVNQHIARLKAENSPYNEAFIRMWQTIADELLEITNDPGCKAAFARLEMSRYEKAQEQYNRTLWAGSEDRTPVDGCEN